MVGYSEETAEMDSHLIWMVQVLFNRAVIVIYPHLRIINGIMLPPLLTAVLENSTWMVWKLVQYPHQVQSLQQSLAWYWVQLISIPPNLPQMKSKRFLQPIIQKSNWMRYGSTILLSPLQKYLSFIISGKETCKK